MPEPKKEPISVALFENNEVTIGLLTTILESSGFSVVLITSFPEDVDDAIQELIKLEVKAAIVSGSMSGENNNDDGDEIVRQIKQVAPKMKTIGMGAEMALNQADLSIIKSRNVMNVIPALNDVLKLNN